MKLLTKDSDYAVRALVYLAGRPEKAASSTEIAEAEDIPLPYLRRLLQVMVRKRLVSAQEGAGGGVVLAKHPRSISLKEVVKAFRGKVEFVQCVFRKKICPNRPTCALRKRMLAIEKSVEEEFSRVTIQDLINDLKLK